MALGMGEDINIVIRATDQASAAINKVNASFSGFRNAISLAATAASAIIPALAAVGSAILKITNDYAKYANQVKQLSILNGTTSEEMSRLVQVAESYRITVEQLTTATRELAKDGQSLTIDTLADMSDAYLALGTAAERTTFLMDNFGQAGLQMADLLAQGSASIRASAAGIGIGEVITQQDLDDVREYEQAISDLEGTWQGLLNTVGQNAIPVMNDVAEAADRGVEAWSNFGTQLRDIQAQVLRNSAISGRGGILGGIIGVQQDLSSWAAGILAGERATDSATQSWVRMGEAMQVIVEQQRSIVLEQQDYSAQLEFTLDFAREYGSLAERRLAIEQEIAEAVASGANQDVLGGLRDDLDDVDAKMREFIGQMVFGFAQAAALADGIVTDEEWDSLMNLGEAMGIFTEETRLAADYAWSIKGALDGMPDEVETDIILNLQGSGASFAAMAAALAFANDPTAATQALRDSFEGGPGYAEGGSFHGWGMVGDAPGGVRTPYTEMVYAPGGATVIPIGKSGASASRSRGYASGGSIPPGGNGTTDLSDMTISKLATQIALAIVRTGG